MKTNSLQSVAAQYQCTLARAAREILISAGEIKRGITPTVIRKQAISPELVAKARAYIERKASQTRAEHTKNPAAVALGRLGGSKKTAAQQQAARKNGTKGGRPVVCETWEEACDCAVERDRPIRASVGGELRTVFPSRIIK